MKLVHTTQLPEMGTSHDENIKKKVFLEKGYIPQLMMFGSAKLTSGQRIEKHAHETMYEVFYVQSGQAIFTVEGKDIVVGVGDCITIDAGETHAQSNPYEEDVHLLYFGIATD